MKYPSLAETYHSRGQIVGGALWDLAHKSGMSLSYVNDLVYDVAEIIETNEYMGTFMDLLIEADDNDGNIWNGTPHQGQIFSAFNDDHYIMGDFVAGSLHLNTDWDGNIVLLDDVYVPVGITLTLKTGADIDLNGFKIISTGGQIINQGIAIEGSAQLKSGQVLKGIYSNIQSAINAANYSINKIIVGAGTYNENLSISNRDNVSIESQNYLQTTISGNINVYSSDYFTLGSITIDGTVDISYSNYDSLYVMIVNDGITVEYCSGLYFNTVMLNEEINIGLNTFDCDIAGSNNRILNNNTGIQCNGNTDISFFSTEFCNNYPYDVSCVGIPYSNDIDLTNCQFSDQTTGARINDVYNDVWWNSWTSCGSRALSKNTVNPDENGSSQFTDYDSARVAYRIALKEFRELYQRIRLENEGYLIDYKDYETELLQIKTNFEKIVDDYSDTPVAVKALMKQATILRLLDEKVSAKNLLDSKENSKDFKSMKTEIKKLRTKFKVADKEFKEAIKDITNLLKELKTDEEIAREIYNKGIIYLFGLEDEEAAKEMFQIVIDLYPSTVVASSAARYLEVDITDEDLAKNNVGKTKQLLLTNYPNPFNPKTVIEYQLPESGFVSLKVFNMLGEVVETLVSKEQPAGKHSVEFDASDLSSGIYFYRIETNGKSENKKMIMMK